MATDVSKESGIQPELRDLLIERTAAVVAANSSTAATCTTTPATTVTTANATTLTTALALVNQLKVDLNKVIEENVVLKTSVGALITQNATFKTSINAILTALKNSGSMASS